MFIWRKRSSLQRRALLLVALPLLSIVTAFTPMFAQNAFAASPADIMNRARAWSILNAVIANRDLVDESISAVDAGRCHIFGTGNDNYHTLVGYHVTGNNNVYDINDGASWNRMEDNTGPAVTALASVGIQNGCRGLLELIGYTFVDGDMEQSDDFGDKLSERIRNATKDKWYGGNIGDKYANEAIRYAILDYMLKSVCGWEYRNPYIANDTAATQEGSRNREAQSNGATGNNGNGHYKTYTYEGAPPTENTYFVDDSKEKRDAFVGPNSGVGIRDGAINDIIDCADNDADTVGARLADYHQYANRYYELIKPGGVDAPGTCADKYGNNATLVAACDAGFKNKDNLIYCNITYTGDVNKDANEACKYGAKTATGDSSTTTPPPGSQPVTEDKTTCAVTGVGWIICPVVNFLALIVDAAYKFVASLLEVQPLVSNGETADIYNAWSVMRNFANIAFVIAFLIIIFSQLTSVGITNYGIKKMLPKLIIAAVLVNVSYWVCAVFVDLSNILGGSLNGLLKGIGETNIVAGPDAKAFGATGEGWAGIAGFILAGGFATVGLLYISLASLLPALVAALAAIVTVFLVLTLRQALIVLLIVVSPLAFVAFLLPNTESLFKKWRDLFQTLLVMYPLISLIFGASSLASTVVMNSAGGDYKIAIQIMGALIAIIPLAITPLVMKTAGGVLNRFGGFVNNPNRGPFDRLRKGAEGIRDDRRDANKLDAMNGVGRSMPFRQAAARFGARRDAVRSNRKAEMNRANADYISNLAQTNADFRGRLAAGGGAGADARALASAINVQADLQLKEVKAASAVIENAHLSSAEKQTLATGGSVGNLHGADDATRIAAIQAQMKSGTLDQAEAIIQASATGSAAVRDAAADGIYAGGHQNKANYMGGDFADRVRAGQIQTSADIDNAVARRIEKGKLSPEALKSQDATALGRFANVADRAANHGEQFDLGALGTVNIGSIGLTELTEISTSATTILKDPRLLNQISLEQRPHIDALDKL